MNLLISLKNTWKQETAERLILLFFREPSISWLIHPPASLNPSTSEPTSSLSHPSMTWQAGDNQHYKWINCPEQGQNLPYHRVQLSLSALILSPITHKLYAHMFTYWLFISHTHTHSLTHTERSAEHLLSSTTNYINRCLAGGHRALSVCMCVS